MAGVAALPPEESPCVNSAAAAVAAAAVSAVLPRAPAPPRPPRNARALDELAAKLAALGRALDAGTTSISSTAADFLAIRTEAAGLEA